MADFPLTYTNIAGSSVTIQPRSVEVELNQRTVRTQSLSGRQQVRTFGTSYYTVTVNFPPMIDEDRQQVTGKLASLRGGVGTFTINPVNFTNTLDTSEDTENLNTSFTGAVGVTAVTTAGSDEFRPGDYFKFSNHTKTYMVTSCSGQTLNFEPFLQTAVSQASGHTIQSGSNFFMTCRLADDTVTYSQGADGFNSISFTAIEAI